MKTPLIEQELEWIKNHDHRITDDYGRPTRPPYTVVAKDGMWTLLCAIHVVGDKAVHEFIVEKCTNRIQIYPGVSLEEATKRFKEIVANDY